MKNLLYCLIVTALIAGCTKDDATTDPNPTYTGTAQVLINSKVSSWMKFTADKPTSLGLTFTKSALGNLSHNGGTNLIVTLPAEAMGKIPFDHVFLNFSHTGHEPPGIYDLAHFDMHFMAAHAERSVIPPYAANTAAKFDNLPANGVPSPASGFREVCC